MDSNTTHNEDGTVDNASAATPTINANKEPTRRYIPPHLRDHYNEVINKNNNQVQQQFEEIHVQSLGDDVPNPIQKFTDLNLDPNLTTLIMGTQHNSLTPIQKYAMPVILEGRDLIGIAPTGSGKTQAYLATVISKLARQTPKPVIKEETAACEFLILSPTRELAAGIYSSALKWASNSNLRCCLAVGGTSIHDQLVELSLGCDILVGTPGRLVDLIERGTISMSKIKCVCLDELDRLLDMGFEPQIRKILENKNMPAVGLRQTLMFSATYPKGVQNMVADYLSDYIHLRLGTVGPRATSVTQHFLHLEDDDKQAALLEALNATDSLTLVIVSTKRAADALENELAVLGLPVTCIHGDKTQVEREQALNQFRAGERPVLVCTDIACRGIDLSKVAHVINYDLPVHIDDYVHRAGRAVCPNRDGFVTSFFTPANKSLAKDIVRVLLDAGQEVPEWLQEYADGTQNTCSQSQRAGRGRASRGRGFGPSHSPRHHNHADTRDGQNNNYNK